MAGRVTSGTWTGRIAPERWPESWCVSRETLERLHRFADLLVRWNRRVNLVAAAPAEALWDRHIRDSCQLVPLIPAHPRSSVDLGSGAGFPGLILAVVTGLPFVLVEADRRKAAFLTEAARLTQAHVTVLPQRAETLTCKADLVTARAAAPLIRLLGWAHPVLQPHGVCLFPKGRNVAAEIAEARAHWRMTLRQIPSVTAPDSTILVVEALSRR